LAFRRRVLYPLQAMKGTPWLWAAAVATAFAVAAACGGTTTSHAVADGGTDASTVAETGTTDASDAGAPPIDCKACMTNMQCDGGAICAALGTATYCATPCDTSSDCTGGEVCIPVNSAYGAPVGVCIPRGGECGQAGIGDAGLYDAPLTCGPLVGGSVDAGCQCPSGRTCAANGCRYGEYCNTTDNTCQPAPIGCGTPGATYDGGTEPTGTLGVEGGVLSRLYFAVVGDTRPPNQDDTAGYPTEIITKIFADIQALSPRPSFVVSTGDYQYATPTGTQGAVQVGLYLTARAGYSGIQFPAMGNHECTGLTNSNCGTGNADGITNNYTTFLQMLLAPVGQTNPYYELDIAASDQSWTAKFLFIAANAWTQTQANWLAAAMARATTYTFLVRHESASADTAPGVNPSENIMAMHPYTLSIVGHTHTYEHSGPREIIIGNGGAPLSGSGDYGYGMLSQQSDGTIAVDMIDYTSGLADPSFHFAVNPDGSPAQ
jgi:hypothetical protein